MFYGGDLMGSYDDQYNPADDVAESGKQALRTGGKAMGQIAKKGAKSAGKALIKGGIKAGVYIISTVGAPLIAIGGVALLLVLLLLVIFGAMPTDMDAREEKLKKYAIEQVDKKNTENTWVVAGDGSWYPGRGDQHLGQLADRYGRDSRLINQWGDIYAPVIMQAMMSDKDEDEMLDNPGWVKERLRHAAEGLKPYFYYKESTVEVEYTAVNEDGEEETVIDSYPVYLLVEAYTIRGHWQYSYKQTEWTEPDGNVRREEKCIRTERVADGKEYLKEYLLEVYEGLDEVDDEDVELTILSTIELAKAFTLEKEHLAWLEGHGALATFVSAVGIPEEYRAYLEEAEQLTGIPVWFLAGLIHRESTWNPNLVTPPYNCFGLTQQHPRWWPDRAARWGFDPERDKWDPRVQILAGAYLLKENGGSVNWESLDPAGEPPPELQPALAFYGGYGKDVSKAQEYINSLWKLAQGYACTGTWPTPGYTTITSQFGMRKHPISGVWKQHTGIDISAPMSAKVVSVSGGVVYSASAGWNGGWGNVVYVRDNQYEYQYAHLSKINVKAGDVVEPGTLIGLVGSTGSSTGPHLHFGIRPAGTSTWIDPLPIIGGLR